MIGGTKLDAWISRVIPLPKEIQIQASVTTPAGQVAIALDAEESPPIHTALDLLRSFAMGQVGAATFTIRLSLIKNEEIALPDDLRTRLAQLPNSTQAYAILPLADRPGLLLVATTGVGLLYASRTLAQLVAAPDSVTPSTPVEIPLATVTDWPDLAERGQWGCETDLEWTAQWKLNALEASAAPQVDEKGDISLGINRDLFGQSARLGVNVIPFILHLEQIAAYSGLTRRADITSTPDPSKPLPSDYIPGLCCSSPATRKLISGWLDKIAALEGVTDLCVWLSEDAAPCFCENCRGREPFELEIACITGAFQQFKPRHPGVRLRLLLSQGSYPVNDKILAVKPADVGVTYYDGGRTYTASRSPMIYPLLEQYSRGGGWLGCYPQVTHSWRTVFPWTAPQFIQYRAQEFAHKRLSAMIGYAVPSNRYHEFNLMAMAEWTWKAEGRSPEQLARAYATVTRVCDPELYARWAARTGEAGWALAETNLFCSLIYDPSLGIAGDRPFDHRFEKAGIIQVGKLEEMLTLAREARELAIQSGNPDMVGESECVLAGLEVFALIRQASAFLRARPWEPGSPAANPSAGSPGEGFNVDDLARYLDGLDQRTQTLRSRLLEWGERVRVRSGEDRLPTRLLDTAFVLFRTCDVYRAMAGRLGLEDPRPELRFRTVGQWSGEQFADVTQPVLRFDVTGVVSPEGGPYQLGVDYIDSAYGSKVLRASVIAVDDRGETVLSQSPDCPDEVSIWERWAELRIEIPVRSPHTRLWLEVEISGLPADAPEGRRTCSGAIGLRRAVPRDTID